MNKKTKIEELEARIVALEKQQNIHHVSSPSTVPIYVHYHNGVPCFNNPCVTC